MEIRNFTVLVYNTTKFREHLYTTPLKRIRKKRQINTHCKILMYKNAHKHNAVIIKMYIDVYYT